MAEMIFNCPHCNQPISCDDAWAGQELQCPMCQQNLVAPPKTAPAASHNPLVPKPPPGGGRLALNQNAQQPAQTGHRDIPVRNLAPPPPKKKNPLVTVVIVFVVLAVLGVGGYFGYGFLSSMQEKTNAKRREVEKNADGGQVGHIADLYDVLDKTEPGNIGRDRGGRATGPRQRPTGVGQEIPVGPDGAASADGSAAPPKKLVAPVYTTNVASAKIPDSPANGTLSGTNFVPDTIRIDPVGTAQVLHFVQGQLIAPDRDILIYLHLKAGEKLGGQTLTVAEDQKIGVPQIHKRWRATPQAGLQSKTFFNGYAMKLELGPATNGMVPGTIYLALPDNEKSVLAGSFKAVTPSVDPNAALQATPVTAPVNPGQSAAEREAFRKRYGVTR